jgi:predicted nucleotidyltransferase
LRGDEVAMQIRVDAERVGDFCRQHHIRHLAVFGSVLRDDFRPNSDVDVLVEFEDGHTPGWELFDLEDELSIILGHRVDLNTPGFLSRSFRTQVLHEARVLYAAR